MNRNEMTAFPSRFDAIMALVDAWAEENAGWDCRNETVNEVDFILGDEELARMSDAQIVESAIAAWMAAE